MKRFAVAVLCALLLIPAASAQVSGPPELSAQCAILVDGESGRVLFERNAHEERDIASITKLMTALVAVEHMSSPEEEVVIRPEWTGIEGSSIYLRAGETVTMETLLYGLLLASGNDAAVAVAGHCAGDTGTFVQWMNDRAANLGMNHTRFANPNGLSEEEHYSTAYDMALLARSCVQNETVAKIMATKSITLGTRTFTNHNKLLWRYEGCVGMKTGYTEKAGRTLVSGAKKDGRTMIAVTLNAPNDWADHAALLDYGFSAFHQVILCKQGKTLCRVPVFGGLVPFVTTVTERDVSYLLTEEETVRAEVTLADHVEAPVEQGAILGTLSFYLGETKIGETNLLSGADVRRNTVEEIPLSERIRNWLFA